MLSPSTAIVLLLSSTSLLVSAAGGHSSSSNSHKALAARRAGLLAHERAIGVQSNQAITPPSGASPRKRGNEEKRCKVKPPVVEAHVVASSSSSSTAEWTAPTTTSEAAMPAASTEAVLVVAPPKDTTTASKESTTAWSAPTTTAAAPAKTSAASSSGGGDSASSNSGILAINDPTCGWSDGSEVTTNQGGPNGKESWITCGINSGGWTPPFVHLNELKAADLATVLASGNSPFGPCAPYIDQMYAVGSEFGIPPILVASFAMQESTCNPSAVGGGGEQGMFQISQDKCGSAPGGNCQDVSYNMRTAMKYFSDTVAGNGGDAFLSMGQYNGWTKGMTFDSATAARFGGCCRCQNNLDYLHQLTNAWMQGHNGNQFGTYYNLKVC